MRNNKLGVVLLILLGLTIGLIIVILSLGNARLQNQILSLQHDRDLLELQNTGPQGVAGKNATDAQVREAVNNYCDTHNQCRGVAGPTGASGPVGATGGKGATGATGDSVASVRCNGTTVSFLDSRKKVLGTVTMVCLR